MMKKFLFWILIIIGIILLLIVLRLLTNPRSRTGDEIRNELLLEMPIGTYEDEMRAFIEEHEHWEIQRGLLDRNEWLASEFDARF